MFIDIRSRSVLHPAREQANSAHPHFKLETHKPTQHHKIF